MTKRHRGPRAPTPPPPSDRRFPVLLAALGAVALLVVIGIVVALSGGDDDDGGSSDRDRAAFGPVTVEGTPLATFVATSGDAAIGQVAPLVEGLTPDGSGILVGGGPDQPTLIVFLAHWCPHCQAELPVLVDLAEAGELDGVRTVAVVTGTMSSAPNYPPIPWLDREGWTGDIILDDESTTAAAAFGLEGYPFMVVLDAEGEVVARTSGEVPPAGVVDLVARATGGR